MELAILASVVCSLTVSIGVVGFGLRMFRMRVARWELWAEQNGLTYYAALGQGLGTIKGEAGGRYVRIKPLKHRAGRGIQRSHRNATCIEVTLSKDLIPLHFR